MSLNSSIGSVSLFSCKQWLDSVLWFCESCMAGLVATTLASNSLVISWVASNGVLISWMASNGVLISWVASNGVDIS